MFAAAQLDFAARPEIVWLALGTVFMLAGTFYFTAKGWGVTGDAREYYTATILVTAIAFASYLSMTFGFGLTEVELVNGRVVDIYWARYADWLFTTPLLLLDLALLADADRTTIGALVGIDAFMIVTGLLGALSTVPTVRYIWWTVSTVSLLVLLYFLFSSLTEKVQEMSEDRQSTFVVLRNAVIFLWLLYPVLWLFGTEGANVIPLYAETLGFMILDVTAKVGFGFVLLRSRAVLGSEDEAPEPSAQAAD